MIKYTQILERLKSSGYQAFLVGGCVRDKMLKLEPHDFDIVTSAKTAEVLSLFPDCNIKVEGKHFQVIFIDNIEVATFRKDIHDENKIIAAVPAKTIEEDLSRRDLTINSMALDTDTGELIDPFGGVEDIENKIIRFTGDPNKRILEDPIRMLRACRFLSSIQRSIFEEDTFFAIRLNSNLLEKIPTERIRLEIIKAMKSKNAGNFFRALKNTNLLQFVFPGMIPTIDHDGGKFHNETIFEHCVYCCDNITLDDPLLKISAFLHDIGKPMAFLLNSNGSFKRHDKIGVEIARKELERLKFSNNEIKFISNMIDIHMFNFNINSTPKSIRKLLVKLFEKGVTIEQFTDHVVSDSDSNFKHEPHPDFLRTELIKMAGSANKKETTFSVKDLEINGNDVMDELNIKPGKEVGKKLRELFDMVINDPKLNTRNKLLTILRGKYVQQVHYRK